VESDARSGCVLRRTRFSDFVTYSGAQKTIVSDRLKRLVADGIFERVEYGTAPIPS